MSDVAITEAASLPDFTSWSLDQLNAERSRLVGSASTTDELSDDDLQRLVAVSHQMRLRTRTAGKPKASSKKSSGPKALDDFDFS